MTRPDNDDPEINEDPDDSDMDSSDEDVDPCPHCGKTIYNDSPWCPHCGQYLSKEDSPTRLTWLYIAIAALMVALVVLYACGVLLR